jgi:mRNA interferase MazF
MPYNFGDVILVRFPFSNQVGAKQRPAVVISSRSYNDAKPDVIIMAITSQLRANASLGEVWLADWQASNLLKPSAVKPVFATVEQPLVIRLLGSLQTIDQLALRKAMNEILG